MLTTVKCTSTTSNKYYKQSDYGWGSEVQSTEKCTTTAFTKVLQTK